MPTYDRGFKLGLLPERKWNWRTFAASYGILVALILLLIVVGIMATDTIIPIVNYHVTEVVPRPELRPEPLRPTARCRGPPPAWSRQRWPRTIAPVPAATAEKRP